MDLNQFEQQCIALERRYYEWREPLTLINKQYYSQKKHDHYPREEYEQDYERIYRELIATYNPAQAAFPIREAMLQHYESASSEDRAKIRGIVSRHSYVGGLLLSYISQCAECLESPEDSWILRSGLIAAAIENYAGWGDFRDTDYALAILGEAAINAGIDIAPIAAEVLPMCSPKMPGYMSTRTRIENFAEFALWAAETLPYEEE